MTTAQADPAVAASPNHILTAIRAVMDQVRGVAKAGEFRQTKGGAVTYNFQKYDDMAAAVGAAFRDQGVMIQATIVSLERETWDRANSFGVSQRWHRVVLRKRYVFTSLVDGSVVEHEALGEGSDNSDKAANKAETGCMKNALKQALLLSTGERDPDDDRPDDSGRPVERVANVHSMPSWAAAERAVEQAARDDVQGTLQGNKPREFPPDRQEKARKAAASINQCSTTGDLDKLFTWATGWDLLGIPVGDTVLGAQLLTAKAMLPAGPPSERREQHQLPQDDSGWPPQAREGY